jgi:hypothetical protein
VRIIALPGFDRVCLGHAIAKDVVLRAIATQGEVARKRIAQQEQLLGKDHPVGTAMPHRAFRGKQRI